jgi:GlcNAc-PI de-N-acetylase
MTDVSFYIATHADDALLFRGDQLYADGHLYGSLVVHVTVSAGDAGRTDGWWQRREEGAVRALAAAQSPGAGVGGAVMRAVNGHQVARYSGSGWVAYFLRLPDGGLDNGGFDSTGHASLGKLEVGSIRTLRAVDGTTTYRSWADLCATLRALCTAERTAGTTAHPWINASDPDRTLNPGDHPDHYAVGEAVRSFALQDGYQLAWWVSYAVRDRDTNLDGLDVATKRFPWETYGWQTGGPNEQEWGWWGPKRYDRTQ